MADQPITNAGHDAQKAPADKLAPKSAALKPTAWQDELAQMRTAPAAKPIPVGHEANLGIATSSAPPPKVTITQSTAPAAARPEAAKPQAAKPEPEQKHESTLGSMVSWVKSAPSNFSNSVHQYLESNKTTFNTNFHAWNLNATDFTGVGNISAGYDAWTHRNEIAKAIHDNPGTAVAATVALVAALKAPALAEKVGLKGLGAAEEHGVTNAILGSDAANLAKVAKTEEVASSIESFNSTLREAHIASSELAAGSRMELAVGKGAATDGLLATRTPVKLSLDVPAPKISRIPPSLGSGTPELVAKQRLVPTLTPVGGTPEIAALKGAPGEASGLRLQSTGLPKADGIHIVPDHVTSAPAPVTLAESPAGLASRETGVRLDLLHVPPEGAPASHLHPTAETVGAGELHPAAHDPLIQPKDAGVKPVGSPQGLKLDGHRVVDPPAGQVHTTAERVVNPRQAPETVGHPGGQTGETVLHPAVKGRVGVPETAEPSVVPHTDLHANPNPESGVATTARRQGEPLVSAQTETTAAKNLHPQGEIRPVKSNATGDAPATTNTAGEIHRPNALPGSGETSPNLLGRDADAVAARTTAHILDRSPRPNVAKAGEVSGVTNVAAEAPAVFKDLPAAQVAAHTTVEATVKELTAFKASARLTPDAADAVRTLETNLGRLSADGAETMTVAARRQAMADVETSMKTLRAEASTAGTNNALEGLEANVAKLRTANDAIVTHMSETIVTAASQDLKTVVAKIAHADSATTDAINGSLERIAATSAGTEARRTAIADLTTDVEKLRATTDLKTFESLEAKVTEIRTAGSTADAVRFQQAMESSATEFNTSVKAARATAGESGQLAQVFDRLETNSAKLAKPGATTAAERNVALEQMKSDLKVLRSTPAASASTEITDMERTLQSMRTSESSLNLAGSELKFSEATPKFTQEIEHAIARPGLSAAQQAELQGLKNTAFEINSPAFRSLKAEEQTALLAKADTQIARVETQLGEDAAAGMRKSFNEVKAAHTEAGEFKVAAETADKTVLTSETHAGVNLASHTEPKPVADAFTAEKPRPLTEPEPKPVGETKVAHTIEEPPVVKPNTLGEGERVHGGRPNERVPGADEVPGAGAGATDGARFYSSEAKPLEELTGDAARAGRKGSGSETVNAVAADAASAENAVRGRVRAEVDATAAKAIEPQLNVAQRSELVAGATEKVTADTAALSKSIDAAGRLNTAGRLGGDSEKSEAALAAMRQEMSEAASAGRAPNFALLKAQAAGLPPEAAAALATRIDGLSTSVAAHNQMLALDGSLKNMSSAAQGLAHQLSQLNVPGMSSTIADLNSGAISLADARDRAAVLRSMSEQLAVLSPSLEAPVAQRLAATIEQLRQSDAAASAALADLVNTQLKRAADLSEAKDALKILHAVVPEGTATSQLVKTASDRLAEVERSQRAAERQIQAEQAVRSAGNAEQTTPVIGLRTAGQQLSDLWNSAMNWSGYRSFAPGTAAALVAAGVLPFAFTSDAHALGLANAQSGKAGGPDALAGTTAVNGQSATATGASTQAAFSGKVESPLSPYVQQAIAKAYNPTLAANWDDVNKARGYFQVAYAPDAVPDVVAPTTYTAPRRFVSTPTAGPDVKPRLVYPGFAQKNLNEMASARQRGFLSALANNTAGVRTLGSSLGQGGQSGTSRIPTGLSRLVHREIMNNVDLAEEGSGGGNATPATPAPAGASINLASVGTKVADADPNAESGTGSVDPQVASLPAAATVLPGRNKSVAV
jgi:hypothetical protein